MTTQPAVTLFNYIYIVIVPREVCTFSLTMEDEYTEYMTCLKEFLLHGTHRRGIGRRLSLSLRDAVGKASRAQNYEVDGK